MKLCSIGAQKKKSKYLEAAILAPISDKKKSDNSQRVNKENIEKPAGRLESTQTEIGIQVKSKLSDINMFRDIVIKSFDSKKIRLGDISDVVIGPESKRGFLRANGDSAIGLGVVRQTKSNVLKVTKAVKDELDLMEEEGTIS